MGDAACVLLILTNGKANVLRIPGVDSVAVIGRSECEVHRLQHEKLRKLQLENLDEYPEMVGIKIMEYKCLCGE
jgi:hypothetical protein